MIIISGPHTISTLNQAYLSSHNPTALTNGGPTLIQRCATVVDVGTALYKRWLSGGSRYPLVYQCDRLLEHLTMMMVGDNRGMLV